MDLSYKQKSAWENLTKAELSELGKLSDSYLDFFRQWKNRKRMYCRDYKAG